MADVIWTTEGKNWKNANAIAGATVKARLVTQKVAADPNAPVAGEIAVATVLADLTEIAGWTGSTPYARKNIVLGGSANGEVDANAEADWKTSEAIDGPTDARAVVLTDAAETVTLAAFNLEAGGAAVDLSVPWTLVAFQPALIDANPWEVS